MVRARLRRRPHRHWCVDHVDGNTTSPSRPQMCTFYYIGLFLLVANAAPGSWACTPCPAQCACSPVTLGSTECMADCSNGNFKAVPTIAQLPSKTWTTVHLNLSGNSLQITSDTFDLLTDLQVLDLSYNSLKSVDQTTFSKLTNLQKLVLAGNDIANFQDKTFELNSLIHLDLSNNPVKNFGKNTFTSASSITSLYMNNLLLDSLPSYIFFNLRKLQHLFISNNSVTTIERNVFGSNKNLQTLDLSHNLLINIEDHTFTDLKVLAHLDFSHNKITYIDRSVLDDLSATLTTLNVEQNPWQCSCSLYNFIQFLVEFNSTHTLLGAEETRCSDYPQTSMLELSRSILFFISCIRSQKTDDRLRCLGMCNDKSLTRVKRSAIDTCTEKVRSKRQSDNALDKWMEKCKKHYGSFCDESKLSSQQINMLPTNIRPSAAAAAASSPSSPSSLISDKHGSRLHSVADSVQNNDLYAERKIWQHIRVRRGHRHDGGDDDDDIDWDGASASVTCYHDVEDMTTYSVRFAVKDTKSSSEDCDIYCFQEGLSVGAFNSPDCYCGDISPEFDCACSNSYSTSDVVTCTNATTSTSESLLFVGSSKWVSSGVRFDPIPKLTMGIAHAFTVRVNLSTINVYKWNFGDSSNEYQESATADYYIKEHTYIIPGTFYLTVKACYSSGSGPVACESATVPVIVQSTAALTSISLVTTSSDILSTLGEVSMAVDLTLGQNMEMMWTKTPDDGLTADRASQCDTSYKFYKGRCILPNTVTAMTYTDAAVACGTNSLLRHFKNPTEIAVLKTWLLSEGYSSAHKVYLEAKKEGLFYKWIDTTYAYFRTSDVTDSGNGDCVVLDLSSGSLMGAACTSLHYSACQQAPINKCPYGGFFLSSNSNCYYQLSLSYNWTFAQQACSNLASAATLAVVNSDVILNHLTSTVISSSEVWVGLSDQSVEGYLLWVNDEALSGYPAVTAPDVDCMSVSNTGTWVGKSCSISLPPICQYSIVKEKVSISSSIAGTADMAPGHSFTLSTKTALTSNPTASMVIVYVFPGLWMTGSGTIRAWNFQINDFIMMSAQLKLQVFRPTCNTGSLITPECSGLGAEFASCSSATCPLKTACEETETFCYLDNSCKPIGDPCNCVMVAASKCGTIYTGSEPTYTLVGETTVNIETSDAGQFFTVPADIAVAEHDVLGFTVDSALDIIKCNISTDADQRARTSYQHAFMQINEVFSGTAWKNDTTCVFNAIYSPTVTKQLPENMKYFTTPGEYTYTFSLPDMGLSKSALVTVEESVSGVQLLYPSLQAGHATNIVYLLAGNTTAYTIHTNFGSNVMCNWTFDGVQIATTSFASSCPTAAQSECSEHINWPFEPFTFKEYTFTTTGVKTIDVSVYNNISSDSYSFTAKVFKIISGVAIRLPASVANPDNNVVYNAITTLTATYDITGGSPASYAFAVNGTPVVSNNNNLMYNFSALETYVVTVNASDDYSFMEGNITVYAKIKASPTNLVVDGPSIILKGVQNTYTVTASVNPGSDVIVAWNFGFGEQRETITNVNSTITHQKSNLYFFAMQNIPMQVKVIDASFPDEQAFQSTLDCVDEIKTITITPTPLITGTSEVVSVQLVITNYGNFGNVLYTFDWGDNSATNNVTSNTQTHTYSTASNYTITGTVTNGASTQVESVIVMVEEPITNFAIEGNSTVYLYSEEKYTMTSSTGSNIMYIYTLSVENSPSAPTSIDIFTYNFTRVGVYTLNVTAYNQKTTTSAEKEIRAVKIDTLQVVDFQHNSFAETGSSVTFVANVLSPQNSILECQWSFGDGYTQSGTSLFTVSRTYSTTGNFTVSLVLKNPTTGQNLTHTSLVRIQDMIHDIKVTTNGTGKLEGNTSAAILLTSVISSGTDVMYNYSYGGNTFLEWSGNTHLMTYSTQGSVNVTVTAYNLLGSVSATITVSIQEAISGVFINCGSCTTSSGQNFLKTGFSATFSASVSTGSDLTYTFLIEGGSKVGQSQSHSFNTKGDYNLTVTVTNAVSSAQGVYSINIQEEITSLSIRTESYALVNQAFNMTTVYSGSDVIFSWVLCFPCNAITTTSVTLENPGYNSPGVKTLQVTATNNISTKTAYFGILIHEEVMSSTISSSQLVSNLYLPINTAITFTCTANVAVHMKYDWTFANDAGISSQQSALTSTSATYTFTTEGAYNVTCVAYNDPSSYSKYIPVKIETPISGLALNLNASNTVATGSTVHFSMVTTGSSLSYAWSKDSTALTELSAELDYVFSTHGTYSITCDVSNPIGSDSKTQNLIILDEVQGVAISVPGSLSHYPFVAVGTSIVFTSSVTAGDSFTIAWTLNDLSSTVSSGTGTTFTFRFSTVTNYTLESQVTNAVSSGNAAETVYIQTPITSLSLSSSQNPAKTNEVITMTANHNADADHLLFKWTIDGSTFVTQTNTYSHTFTTPGSFVVSVQASNEISNQTSSLTLTLQDVITGFAVSGCDTEIRVSMPATASASLTTGTDVSYKWTTEDSNGNVVQQTGSSFSFTYDKTNIYAVHLQVSNLVDSQNHTCQYTVIGIISNLAIDMSDSIYFTSYNIYFKATGNNLVGSTYTWDLAPISVVTTTNVATTSKVFSVKQNYTMTLNASNSISFQVVEIHFFIDQLTCVMATLDKVGQSQRSVARAKPIMFEVDINRHGCTDYVFTYAWSVSSASTCSSTLTPYSLAGVTMDTPKLTLADGTLSYGQYCVKLVAEYKGTPLSSTIEFELNVTMSDLQAVVKGGSTIERPAGENIVVDGSASYDPDKMASLTYSWTCFQSVSLTPGLNACTGVSGSSSFVTLAASSLEAGQEYSVTLTVSALGRKSSVQTQIVKIIASNAPLVTSFCQSCSAASTQRFSKTKKVALTGSCSNCPSSATVTYAWSATYDNSGSASSFTLDTSNTNTGVDKANLVINPDSLLLDKTFTFKLTVTKTENSVTSVGHSSIVLSPNQPPVGSGCTLTTAGSVTPLTPGMFCVDCSSYTDPDSNTTELYYKVLAYKGTDMLLLYYGTKYNPCMVASPWPGASRSALSIKVYIIDEDGGATEGLDTNVAFGSLNTPVGQSNVEYLLSLAKTDLLDLIQENNPVQIMQYIVAMIQELNQEATYPPSPDNQLSSRATLRNILSLIALGLPLDGTYEEQQMAFLMNNLLKFPDEYQNGICQNLVLSKASEIKSSVKSITKQGSDQEDIIVRNLLGTASNTITAVNQAISSLSTTSEGNFTSDMSRYIPSISSLTNIFGQVSQSSQSHQTTAVENAFSLGEDILAVTLKSMLIGEEPMVSTDGKMTVYAIRRSPDDIYQDYAGNAGSIVLHQDLLSGVISGQDVFQLYIEYDPNPFTWGQNSGELNTKLLSLSFKDTTGGQVSVQSLSSEKQVEIIMPNKDKSLSISGGNLYSSPDYDPLNMTYSYIELDAGTSKQINLGTVSPHSSSALHLQIRFETVKNDTPTDFVETLTTYVWKDVEIPSESNYWKTQVLSRSDMEQDVDHTKYTIFVQDYNPASTYKFGIKNTHSSLSVNVSVAVYFSSCQYYDTTSSLWSSSGCAPQESSIASVVVCHCNHLTAFSGHMLVPIGSISFADLVLITIPTNPVVFVTCSIILAIYIIAVIVCRRLDRMDIERISKVPMCGKDGSFKYEVTVVTGNRFGAGTTAHVGIKLHGEYGSSKRKLLTKKGAFQRGCQDSFLIAHDTNLGDLSKIFVWHDNHGLSPDWFLVQILIRDLQTEQRYYFFANAWFSLAQDDGVIQRDIHAAGSADIQRFSRIMGSSLCTSLTDKHLWVSVSDRPANSRFTRVQRATCIVTIIYVFMCVNAMWYGVLKTEESVENFGWEEIVLAIITNLVVFPFSIILTSIFKKSRSKSNVFEQGNRASTAQTMEIEDDLGNPSEFTSFRSNDDFLMYPDLDRESTTDSLTVKTLAQPASQFRRTKTLKKSSHQLTLDVVPSSAGSASSRSSEKTNDAKLKRTNNPGMWRQDSFDPTTAHEETLPTVSRILRQEPKPEPTWEEKQAIKKESEDEVKEAADEIMNYLDTLESELMEKDEQWKRKICLANNVPPASTLQGKRPKFLQEKKKQKDREEMERKQRLEKEERELREKREAEEKAKADKRKTALLSRKPTHVTSLGNATVVAGGSASSSKRQFTPRADAKLNDRKLPSSAGSLTKWVSKLKHTQSSDSFTTSSQWKENSTMTDVEHTNHAGPLQPDHLLARQHSQPDVILTRTFSMDPGDRRKEDKLCTLPSWFVYIGYFLCFAFSALSVILVLLYGYQFGSEIALHWILALLFSMFFSFLLFEPIKVLFMAIYITVIKKKHDPYDEDDAIDIKPTIDNFVETVKEMKFKPLAGFALVNARDEAKRVQRMWLLARQTIAYLCYLWLLMVLCYVHFSSSQYHLTNRLQREYVYNQATSTGYSFHTLKSINEFWNWSQTHLAENLHAQEFYNFTEHTVLLGKARLRQVRGLSEKECIAYYKFESMGRQSILDGKTCVSSGSSSYSTDMQDYAEGWAINRSNLSWFYYTSSKTKSKHHYGNLASYEGGGYVQYLGNSYQETVSILADLQQKNWITLNTRAVFVDFTLYNPATDLTSYVQLVVEVPVTGYLNTSFSIETQKLFAYREGYVDALMICQCIMFLVLVYLFIHVALTIIEKRLSYFKSFWNVLELIGLAMLISCVGLYIGCVVEASAIFEEFSLQSNEYHNFESVTNIHIGLRYTQAWLLFLLMITVVKQIRFIKILSIYDKTLSKAFTTLLAIGFLFCLLHLIFCMAAYLIYGSEISGFETFGTTLTTLVTVIRGMVNFWPMLDNTEWFTHLFFYLYYIFVYGLTTALTLAVLSDTYRRVRKQMFFKSTLDMQDYEMIDFIMKRFKLWIGITKPKPEFRKVHFKGLPSIPSRCTTAQSIRSIGNEYLSRSDSIQSVEDQLHETVRVSAELASTWEKVLQTMDRVSFLDNTEENLMKQTQKSVDDWKFNVRIQKLEQEREGLLSWNKKPPMPPHPSISSNRQRNSKVNRRVSTDSRFSTARSEGGMLTPMSKITIHRSVSQGGNSRPFSDQGGRIDQAQVQPQAQPQVQSRERMSVYNFFKSLKPSKSAW